MKSIDEGGTVEVSGGAVECFEHAKVQRSFSVSFTPEDPPQKVAEAIRDFAS